jgi:hypothetical protein
MIVQGDAGGGDAWSEGFWILGWQMLGFYVICFRGWGDDGDGEWERMGGRVLVFGEGVKSRGELKGGGVILLGS